MLASSLKIFDTTPWKPWNPFQSTLRLTLISSPIAGNKNSTLKTSPSIIEARYTSPERYSDGVTYKIVCYYYAVEAWYRNSRGMFLPEDIDATKCTHIHYAYAILNPETLLIEPSDKWAEIDNRFYQVGFCNIL